MLLSKDWKEFLLALNSQGVEYVLVGGLAVGYHAEPRFTGDLDILIRPTAENVERMMRALRDFGLGSLGVTEADLLTPGSWLQFGVRPNRIDVLNAIDGVEVEDVWRGRIAAVMDGVTVGIIDRESLLRNKKATGRVKDLADAAAIEGERGE